MKNFHWNFSLSAYPEIGRSALLHFLENTYIHTYSYNIKESRKSTRCTRKFGASWESCVTTSQFSYQARVVPQ